MPAHLDLGLVPVPGLEGGEVGLQLGQVQGLRGEGSEGGRAALGGRAGRRGAGDVRAGAARGRQQLQPCGREALVWF